MLIPLSPAVAQSISAATGWRVDSDWGAGANTRLTITNTGANAITLDLLEFQFDRSITPYNNMRVSSHTGNHYALTNEVYYPKIIAPGAAVYVDMQVNPGNLAGAQPTNYLINGLALSEGGGGSTNLQITTSALPAAGLTVAYSQTLAASGGTPPYSWVLASGGLPGGLSLSGGGTISGTPTNNGTFNFTVQVSDSAGSPTTTNKAFAIAVATLPTLAVNDVSIVLAPYTNGSGSNSFFSTSGNQIVDAGGNPVRLTGINWFGFETSNKSLHGLWSRGYRDALDQIKALGFNTLRIPFSNAMLAPGAATSSIDSVANPDLQGLTPLQVLDKIVAYCGQIGLRIILDRHSARSDGYINEDVWYIPGDAYYTEQRWIDDWVLLATHYAGNATVIGADLFNEPKKTATWGNSAPATDWNKAAERCGNAILATNPDWLIIVEGTQNYAGISTWWGGNLKGAAAYPVVLNVTNKLVYSMHDYPASVFVQTWFTNASYPTNLASVWDGFGGYLYHSNTAPLFFGEFGTRLATVSDQQWLDKLTDYMDGDFNLNGTNDLAPGKKGMSFTFWCFNPNSGDTGGILNDDWTTVDQVKLSYLTNSFAPVLGSGAVTNSQPAQTLLFTVSLSQVATGPVSVQWVTTNGTAMAGTDYIAGSGTVNFVAGESNKTIAITIPPHPATQTRQLTLLLSAPAGATLADSTGTGTILPSTSPAMFTISGAVELQAFIGTNRQVRFVMSQVNGGSTNYLQTNDVTLNFSGGVASFNLTVPTNTTHISAKTAWHLRRRQAVYFSGGSATVNFTSANNLKGGDIVTVSGGTIIDTDNAVSSSDYLLLLGNYLQAVAGDQDISRADINGDGVITSSDYLLLLGNYLTSGDTL